MNFLQTVVSTAGRNLITGPRKSGYGWHQEWVSFSDVEATERAIDSIQSKGSEVYFALGAFDRAADGMFHRRQINCSTTKSFWVDIDAGEEKFLKHGPTKVYRTQRDALLALYSYIEWSGLPDPTYIISSGAGLHVYWAIETDMPVDVWRKIALVFKASHFCFGLLADPTRTADSASVLRPIGTTHYAGNTVKVLSETTPYSFEFFLSKIVAMKQQHPEISEVRSASPQQGFDIGAAPEFLAGRDSVMDDEIKSAPKRFSKIIRLHEVEGAGCKQLYDMYINQEHVPEPLWAAGLSIIKFCEDSDEWSRKFSENHPAYDPVETSRKMNQWLGPRTCAWFKENNPDGCEGCPHSAKFKETSSPIVLAMNPDQGPVEVVSNVIDPTTSETTKETFIIPTLPFPFVRGPNGGVYLKRIPKDEEVDDPEFNPFLEIYPYDFYIHERIGRGADGRPRFWARHHTPCDGVAEFAVSSDIVTAGAQELRTLLGTFDVYVKAAEINHMSRYLNAQVTGLQQRKSILQAPMQLGWTPNGEFVLGRLSYSKSGIKPAPIPSTNLAQKFARACEPQISKEPIDRRVAGWNNVIRDLYGSEDAGMYRLVLASGIGAPVRALCSIERGGIMNLYSEQSGFGKSTLTKAILRMYANPDDFFYQANSGITANALSDTLSYVNSIPLVLDEAGKFHVRDLMDIVHLTTSGQPKVRGSASLNDVRQTAPGWKTFVYSSSNKSLWNTIIEHQHENEAYLMRIAEININPLKQSIDKSFGDRVVRELEKYQGVVATQLFPWLVRNRERVEQMWVESSEALTAAAQLHGRTRFWADIMTSAIVGAKIGEEIGVYPFHSDEIFTLAVQCINEMKARASTKAVDDTQLLSEFLNANLDTICVVVHETNNLLMRLPTRQVAVRVEVYSGKIYIDPIALQKFASTRQFGVERIESAIESLGGRRGQLVQLLKGTSMASASAPTRAWEVDVSNYRAREFFDLDSFAKMAEIQGEVQ